MFSINLFQDKDIDFHVGLNLKYINQEIGDISINDKSKDYCKHSFGSDFGILILMPELVFSRISLQAGLTVQNLIQPKYKYNGDEDVFPTTFRYGIGFDVELLSGLNVMIPIDIEKIDAEKGRETAYYFGMELNLLNHVFFRVGTNSTTDKFAGGLGFYDKYFKIDIARVFSSYRDSYINNSDLRVTFSLQF